MVQFAISYLPFAKLMNIEYEATFTQINKDEIRKKLQNIGAKLIKPEFLMTRIAFYPPPNIEHGWMRVRDEQDKITMCYKRVDRKTHDIANQKEIEVEINDFKKGCQLLEAIGCKQKAFQETKREIWHLDNVEISIDTWPGLNPLIEIEGKNEPEVKKVAEKLGFNWQEAIFDSIDYVYEQELGITRADIKFKPKLTFENPPRAQK